MTTLIRDNNGAFQLPQTLRQGQNFTDPQGRTGIVNFDTATGKPLAIGGTTPSFQLPASPQGNTYMPPTQPSASPQIMSFTDALIKILKDAQGKNQTGQAALMAQSNQITGQGVQDAGRIFNDGNFDPSSGTSLGSSAMNAYDPQQNSIADQQKLANANLGNITDLVNLSQDAYNKEQNRIYREKQDAIDNKYKRDSLAASKVKSDENFNPEKESPKFVKDFESIKGDDNYVDPAEWIAARTLWGLKGGTDSSFVSNFKRYLNPASYKKAGIGTTDSVSNDWGVPQ